MTDPAFDRRDGWKAKPRPEWVATLNQIGRGLNAKSIVPLTPVSLMDEATRNTGLRDFGNDGWEQHFRVLLEAIDNEADLHFAGRLLTRTEFLMYLEARLNIVEWYRRFPQTTAEVIDQPVLITGYGRSGTTILFEVLSQDPQFRVAQKWESLFPCPPPAAESYQSDPRIKRAEAFNTLFDGMIPELKAQHKTGGDLPVESVELEYLTFLSDVYPIIVQVPSYAKYLAGQDLTYTFEWTKTILKLLQSKFSGSHWLMKSPSHLPHLAKLLQVFPDMKFIFAHRDPLVSADSVVSFLGTLYWLRTDNPWGGGGAAAAWALQMADDRARVWDGIIELIESGKIATGNHASFHYGQFMIDPIKAIAQVYDDLRLTLTSAVATRMKAYLDSKFQGKFGQHSYEPAPPGTVVAERKLYKKYQDYFGIPSEF
jgi:Sulfotransferase family